MKLFWRNKNIKKMIVLLGLIVAICAAHASAFNMTGIVSCFNGSSNEDYYHHIGSPANSGVTYVTTDCLDGLGSCWNSSTTTSRMNAQNNVSFMFSASAGTFMWWVLVRTVTPATSHDMVGGIAGDSCLTAGRIVFYMNGDDRSFYTLLGNGASPDTGFDVPLGSWQHMAVRWNNSMLDFFNNGTFKYHKATLNGWASTDFRDTGACGYEGFDVFNNPSLGERLNGMIDEWSIWNRSLTDTEIMEVYTKKHTCTFTSETQAPSIANPVCTSCYSGNYSVDATPTINVTCTDSGGCLAVRVSNNSALSYTQMNSSRNCTAGAGSLWVCTLPESDRIPNGGNVYFTASDNLGNSHSTYNLSITINAAKYLMGNVTDSNLRLIANASIFIMANNSNNILYNLTSTSEGKWNKTVVPGTYTVCGYAPYNQSLRGDCLPFIQVT